MLTCFHCNIQQLQSFFFSQDNCPVHTARLIREWVNHNNINVLPWPAKSPDLNPIENVWGYIVKQIYKRPFRPENADELWQAIENAWEDLVDTYDMRSLIMSMTRRLESVVVTNGSATKY